MAAAPLTESAGLSAFVVFASFGSLGVGRAADAVADAAGRRWCAPAARPGSRAACWRGARGRAPTLPRTTGLSAEQGLALFDRALAADAALLAPVLLDPVALRARARERTLPAPLRGSSGSPPSARRAAGR
ncbi:hypothetical protein NKH77_44080 [Streptomyces sp. M19]